MKKTWKRILSLVFATVLTVGMLTGCEEEQTVINAYDIAVKNGFVGTEEDWLLSLQGANGSDGQDVTLDDLYQAAKNEGFEGSLLDFIYSLGANVQENNATQTIAQNMTSVVSVCSAFIKTEMVGSYWNKHEEKSVTGAEGSGVVLHLEKNRGVAYIVTNYHVVYDLSSDTGISEHIWIYPYGARDTFSAGDIKNGVEPGDIEGGDGIRATFIGGAMDYDIALLQVNSTKVVDSILTTANVGDSESITVGEKTFAIGNAEGMGIAVTNGILSVDSEYISMRSSDNKRAVTYRVMRTDAPINHGNSGGGLFNAQGQLIGIVNAKSIASETDNVGYALPITSVKYALKNIWDNITNTKAGFIARAFMGIETYIQHSKAVMENGSLKIIEEFAVSSILTEGAVGAGNHTAFKVGDVIMSMTHNGVTTKLTRRHQMTDLLLNVRLGDTVTFTVLRDSASTGKEEVQVTIAFDKAEYFYTYA